MTDDKFLRVQWQVIDGKLIKLGHEPQVVVSNVDSRLYLVNDSGIIAKEMEHMSSDNVASETLSSSCDTNELPRDIEMLHEQLSEARLEIEGLRTELTNQNAALDDLRSKLEAARCIQ